MSSKTELVVSTCGGGPIRLRRAGGLLAAECPGLAGYEGGEADSMSSRPGANCDGPAPRIRSTEWDMSASSSMKPATRLRGGGHSDDAAPEDRT